MTPAEHAVGALDAAPLLALRGVQAGYGTTLVLRDVSLNVARGEAVALLGRNGMGKTTTLRAIMGLNPALAGSITFRGEELRRLPPFEIARRGIGYVPEGRQIFAPLSVTQNLRVPFVNKHPDHSQWKARLAWVFELFPALAERRRQPAGSLSGGEQQMLAIARALVGGDELLILDEPTEGLAPPVVAAIIDVLGRLKAGGLTVLIVEQNVHTAFAVADRAYVIEKGSISASGLTAHLKRDREFLERHLGVAAGTP